MIALTPLIAAAGYATSKLVNNEGSWNFESVATDACGNALGNSIVNHQADLDNRRKLAEQVNAIGVKTSVPSFDGIDQRELASLAGFSNNQSSPAKQVASTAAENVTQTTVTSNEVNVQNAISTEQFIRGIGTDFGGEGFFDALAAQQARDILSGSKPTSSFLSQFPESSFDGNVFVGDRVDAVSPELRAEILNQVSGFDTRSVQQRASDRLNALPTIGRSDQSYIEYYIDSVPLLGGIVEGIGDTAGYVRGLFTDETYSRNVFTGNFLTPEQEQFAALELATGGLGGLTNRFASSFGASVADTARFFRIDDSTFGPRIVNDAVPLVLTNKGKGPERTLFVNIEQPDRALEFAEKRISQGIDPIITVGEIDNTLFNQLKATSVHDKSVSAGLNPSAPLKVDFPTPNQFGLRTSDHIQSFREAIVPGSVKVVDLDTLRGIK